MAITAAGFAGQGAASLLRDAVDGWLSSLSAASVRRSVTSAGPRARALRSPSIVRRSGGCVPPGAYPTRAEGVAAARRARAALKIEVDATGMDAVAQPPAIRLPLRPYDRDRLRHPRIGVRARVPEVIQRAQHVVVPVIRKRELQILRPGDGRGALAAEHAALRHGL